MPRKKKIEPVPKVANHPLHQRIAYWRLKQEQNDQQDSGWSSKAAEQITRELGCLYEEGFNLALAAMKKAVFEPEADEILSRAILELEGGKPDPRAEAREEDRKQAARELAADAAGEFDPQDEV